ncbi:MAG: HEAT repeat domain-containing protein, partial [Bacteroidia bacterium]|nr:HEAT repeat domain-containing protein [Bacteroidia bacterium]
SEAVLQAIVALLKDEDYNVRSSAVEALGSQEKLREAVLQAIVALLKDEESDVRNSAVSALGRQEKLSEAVLQAIVAFLKDEYSYVRRSAVSALGRQEKLRDAYLQAIVALLKDEDSSVRSYAVEALGRQEKLSEAYLQAIVAFLKDEYSYVRRSAVYALGRQEKLSEAYLQAIVALFKDEDFLVRRSAVSALGRQEKLRDAYLQAIVALLKDEDSEVRRFAVEALGGQENLSEAYLQAIVAFLKDEDWQVRISAVEALGRQEKLSEAVLQAIVALLKDESSYVRISAVEALGRQEKLSEAVLQAIVALLKDEDYNVRSSAVYALGRQEKLSEAYLQAFVALLKDEDYDVRSSAVEALGKQSNSTLTYLDPQYALLADASWFVGESVLRNLFVNDSTEWMKAFPFLTEKFQSLLADINSGKTISGSYEVDFLNINIEFNSYTLRKCLFEASGGRGDLYRLWLWMCQPLDSKYPAKMKIEESRKTLDLMVKFEESQLDTLLKFRKELLDALPNLIQAAEPGWTASKDLTDLRKARDILKKYKAPGTAKVQGLIDDLIWGRWYNVLWRVLLIHFLFWLLLIFAYPHSSMVQAIFFWHPYVRKIFGFPYVSFLTTWIPFLRKRMFAPFKENLLADAFPAHWNKQEYFPESQVYSLKEKKTDGIFQALRPLRGQVLLQGESGLGKTMFLREMAYGTGRIVAFLPANRCAAGLIPAIQHKLHGAAADEGYLRKLIYAGAIDLYIDGLNEISVDARSKLINEVERYFKGNLILTSQPMEWEPPATARLYKLQPLSEEAIGKFLLGRYPYLSQEDLIPESVYESKAKEYLQEVFDKELDAVSLKANRHVLSNPMDLVVVAQLLGRGEKPGLLDLQEQQYRLMAADFKEKNQNRDFPLEKFSKSVYEMRLGDESAIPAEEFGDEIKSLERWKMVQLRQFRDEKGKEVRKWYFRHDKVMDYFLVQEFLGDYALIEEHLSDPRFRGVYFLLAHKLPIEVARQLRERLIHHASETKDHSLSDTFVQLFMRREVPRLVELDAMRAQVARHLARGQHKEALEVLEKYAGRKREKDVVALQVQSEALEREQLKGTVNFENGTVRRNQINEAILVLADGLE